MWLQPFPYSCIWFPLLRGGISTGLEMEEKKINNHHPFCSLTGPVPCTRHSPARFKFKPFQPGAVGWGGEKGLPAPATALPG